MCIVDQQQAAPAADDFPVLSKRTQLAVRGLHPISEDERPLSEMKTALNLPQKVTRVGVPERGDVLGSQAPGRTPQADVSVKIDEESLEVIGQGLKSHGIRQVPSGAQRYLLSTEEIRQLLLEALK